MKWKQISAEVYYATEPLRTLSSADVAELLSLALDAPGGKARICLHHAPDETLHEMLIAMGRNVRYPIHMHTDSDESYSFFHGRATLTLFDEQGGVLQTVDLGPFGEGEAHFVRVPRGTYHSLEITSESVVFLESKLGPFSPESNKIAPFAGLTPGCPGSRNTPEGQR